MGVPLETITISNSPCKPLDLTLPSAQHGHAWLKRRLYPPGRYALAESMSNSTFNYTGVPWGLGAWGPMNSTFGDPPKWPSQAIPLADRKACIDGVASVLADKKRFPRFAASIYFNSLKNIISPRPIGGSNTPELVRTFKAFLELAPFVANDQNATPATEAILAA